MQAFLYFSKYLKEIFIYEYLKKKKRIFLGTNGTYLMMKLSQINLLKNTNILMNAE